MGRNNADFHHSVMFHGSSSQLNVGDSILPMSGLPSDKQTELIKERPTHRSGSSVEPDKAFASNHLGVAQLYAGKTGKVYTVEPLDKDEMKISQPVPEEAGKNPIFYYTSQKGFKVTGEHNGEK
jgi:hypothetical protein